MERRFCSVPKQFVIVSSSCFSSALQFQVQQTQSDLGFALSVDGAQGQIFWVKCTSGPLVMTQILNFKHFSLLCALDFFRMSVVLCRLGRLQNKYLTFSTMLKSVNCQSLRIRNSFQG